MSDEQIVGILASRYSWPGAEREDVAQEAWFALERARPRWRAGAKSWPNFAWLCVESHLLEVQRRECFRRPRFYELRDRHSSAHDVVSQVDARRSLRTALELELPPRERRALDGLLAGEALLSRTEHMARYRAKRKLLTALS